MDEAFDFRAVFLSERRNVKPYDVLNGCKINIQLCEDPGNSAIVKSLAFYSRDAQEFFGEVDRKGLRTLKTREIFLRRTTNFPGPPIRMKFTATTFIREIQVKHHSQFENLLTSYNLMIPDNSYFTEDKQLLHSNSITKHLSLINRNCSRDAECSISLIKIPDESSDEIDETNLRNRINPINLSITSSLSVMNPYKHDYGRFIYPADRLKLSNLQIIIKDEETDSVENDADF
ncbi:unnamed protein product [Schistosoma intercalatum]|nr:unnamed protein product [Schistosoma intercalatum]CAH8599219.1 unnamed protein product [Schistosoma intercalatum]